MKIEEIKKRIIRAIEALKGIEPEAPKPEKVKTERVNYRVGVIGKSREYVKIKALLENFGLSAFPITKEMHCRGFRGLVILTYEYDETEIYQNEMLWNMIMDECRVVRIDMMN